jgi:hypothetical protein
MALSLHLVSGVVGKAMALILSTLLTRLLVHQ